jgi:energy-coupling factor transporter ATP-binding protein EcfA2
VSRPAGIGGLWSQREEGDQSVLLCARDPVGIGWRLTAHPTRRLRAETSLAELFAPVGRRPQSGAGCCSFGPPHRIHYDPHVIQAVAIRGLRGIREGELSDLTPLVILVGPNGCGKSTVLEALFIGASNTPGEAIGKCVQRRSGVWNGSRWLFARPATGATDWHVRVQSHGGGGERTTALLVPGGYMILALAATGGQVTGVQLQFQPDNRWVVQQDAVSQMLALRVASDVRLVEPRPDITQPPLHRVYSAAVQNGKRREAEEFVRDVLPGFVDLEILTAPDSDQPEVNVVFQSGALPLALAGDGVQALVRQCLELAALKDGLALLEEPEAFKHPAAIRQTARAIVAATKRGVQVILATHSLELIDAIVEASDDAALDNLSLYRLALKDGALKSSRLAGGEVKLLRAQIEEDLR